MVDLKETCCEFLNVDKHATFCSSETKWINKIIQLKEQYPDDIHIQVYPEDNQGMILAHIPKSFFKLNPPRKRNMTEEQRQAIAERLSAGRKQKYG